MSNWQKDIKMSKRYQIAKKMSKVKSQTPRPGKKLCNKQFDTMHLHLTYNDVNFDVAYEDHKNWSKHKLNILRIFDDHHM